MFQTEQYGKCENTVIRIHFICPQFTNFVFGQCLLTMFAVQRMDFDVLIKSIPIAYIET